MENFLKVDDISNEEVQNLLNQALEFKRGASATYGEQTIVNMFFEDSTRTSHSFEMAEHHLGLHVMNFDAANSSVNKGESLYDSVLTMQALGADIAVIRHSHDTFYEELQGLEIAVVNAGSGAGEHPSQSMLDILTIYEHFGTFEGLKILLVGDLVHSRVAMSNMKLLKRLGAEIFFSGPEVWFDDKYLSIGKRISMDEGVAMCDVCMLHRIQLERHTANNLTMTNAEYLSQYGMNEKRYATLKDTSIILHPAPVNRDVEIADSLVEAPKSKIYQQMQNGVYMRMAILEQVAKGC